eukprot:3379592-Prymnesium_polylepis.1
MAEANERHVQQTRSEKERHEQAVARLMAEASSSQGSSEGSCSQAGAATTAAVATPALGNLPSPPAAAAVP